MEITYSKLRHQVLVQASGRHIHLTEESFKRLFPTEYKYGLFTLKPLVIDGEYATNLHVEAMKDGKRMLFTVMYPLRSYDQIEWSETDARYFKKPAVLRHSGDLKDAPFITVRGDSIQDSTAVRAIIAEPHIHIDANHPLVEGLTDKGGHLTFIGEKGLMELSNIGIKVNSLPESGAVFHIDTDTYNGLHNTLGEYTLYMTLESGYKDMRTCLEASLAIGQAPQETEQLENLVLH
jgi:propanediol utilization protein